jgi:hypothetical protein
MIFRRAGLALPKKRRRSVRAMEIFALPLTGRVIYWRLFTQRVALGCYALPLRGDGRRLSKIASRKFNSQLSTLLYRDTPFTYRIAVFPFRMNFRFFGGG